MEKTRDLLIILVIYFFSYTVSFFTCNYIDNILLKYFIFDTNATIIVFIFSVLFKNSSVYDAYWSITPMIMIIGLYIEKNSFSLFNNIFLIVFCIWAIRLTINWCVVFTDFNYEDWRYKKFRNETNKFLWPIVNFFGIHYMPTIIVFLGMLPIFEIIQIKLTYLSLIGILMMIFGIFLELFADRNMHQFLNSKDKDGVCEKGLWNYSRHPNYLGEITFWFGVYVVLVFKNINYWYYGIGALTVAIMFNIISIPLMEKRQLEKRSDYKRYCTETSKLLLLPKRKKIIIGGK